MDKLKKILIKLLPDEIIEEEYVSRFVEDVNIDTLDKEACDLLLQEISKVENIDEFLLTALKKDRVRYFNSPREAQDIIKGAALRTIWLLKEIRNSRGEKEIGRVVIKKYTNPRQG